jgi:hypothetical protein
MAFSIVPAKSGADLLVGSAGATRSEPAWRLVYRALEHGYARNACLDGKTITSFPKSIQSFATIFVAMQIKRHDADYDPTSRFRKSEVEQDIVAIEQAIREFARASIKDRTAFCAHVLFRKR